MNWGLGIEHEFFLSLDKLLTKDEIKTVFNHDVKEGEYLVLFPFDTQLQNLILKKSFGKKEIFTEIYSIIFTNSNIDYFKFSNLKKINKQLIELFLPFLTHFDGLSLNEKKDIIKLNKEYFSKIYSNDNFQNLKNILNIIQNDTLENYFIKRNEIIKHTNYPKFFKFDKGFPKFPINSGILFKTMHKEYLNINSGLPNTIYYNDISIKKSFTIWRNKIYLALLNKQKLLGFSNNVLETDYHNYGFMFEMKTSKYKNIKFNDFKQSFSKNHQKLIELFSILINLKYPNLNADVQIETQSYYHGNICVINPTTNDIIIEMNTKRYLGSYHFWFTPPYTNNYLNYFPYWFSNLKNFAKWLQWIEPLITVFFKHNDTNGESKVSYRDIVNFFAAYGSFDVDKMIISTKRRGRIIVDKPPFTKTILKEKILFKPVEINEIKYKNKDYKLYFMTDELADLNAHERQGSNDLYFKNTKIKTYVNQLINNNIKVKNSFNMGADIRLGDMNKNFINGNFVLYKEGENYDLYSLEEKNGKFKVSKPKIKLPNDLVGLEFRILDNMLLDNVFIIYHFCLLGLEMTKTVELETATKNQKWHDLFYLIMKNGVSTKIPKNIKKTFENVLHCSFSDNFENWFYEYFDYLFKNYQKSSPIL